MTINKHASMLRLAAIFALFWSMFPAAALATVQSHEQNDLLYSDPIRATRTSIHSEISIDEQRRLGWQELSCSDPLPATTPEKYIAAGDTRIDLGDESPISVVGTTISGASYWCNCNATINFPSGTADGDLLILFVAGSDGVSGAWLDSADTARLGRLLKDGWAPIEKAGSSDLNVIALWKLYHAKEEDNTTDVTVGLDEKFIDGDSSADIPSITVLSHGVSNTWLTMVALRRTRSDRPIRATGFLKTKSAKTCKNGEAMAPSVRMSPEGVVLSAFTYDDPHQATIISPKGFHLLSSFSSGDDGMAVGLSERQSDGMMSGDVKAIGKTKLPGGGQAIGMSVSIRAA